MASFLRSSPEFSDKFSFSSPPVIMSTTAKQFAQTMNAINGLVAQVAMLTSNLNTICQENEFLHNQFRQQLLSLLYNLFQYGQTNTNLHQPSLLPVHRHPHLSHTSHHQCLGFCHMHIPPINGHFLPHIHNNLFLCPGIIRLPRLPCWYPFQKSIAFYPGLCNLYFSKALRL